MGQRILIVLCVVFALQLQGQGTTILEAPYWKVEKTEPGLYSLDFPALREALLRDTLPNKKIIVPLPGEELVEVVFNEHSSFSPELSARYPGIKSFRGVVPGYKDRELRLSVSHKGIRAIYLWPGKRLLLEKEKNKQEEVYRLSTVKDLKAKAHFGPFCALAGDHDHDELDVTPKSNGRGRGFNLRVFDMVIGSTGEYAQYHGGTVTDVMAAFNETLLHVNAVFETELAIRLRLVENTTRMIFLDPETDPYTEGDKEAMFQENQTTAAQYVGLSKFDIGHLFNTTFGGLASISSLCNYSRKAKGVSGMDIPEGYYFDLIVLHELGHQFGAKHTQNSDCNLTEKSAFEPGSGSTIMSYAGLCEPNVQTLPDDYFHNESLKTISRIVRSGVTAFCVENIELDNNEPSVNAGPNYTIPISTPFELKGTGFDADGDPLLYNWEQFDRELVEHPPRPEYTEGPVFRSYPPTASPTRMIPAKNFLINNVDPIWEVLPSVSRLAHFQLSVRDNHEGVGISDYDEMIVIFSEEAGPFVVTQPTQEEEFWFIGETVNIVWDVANTDQEPIDCQKVNILLSQDGGETFPMVLAEEVPNNGQFSLIVPNLPGTQNRIKIEAVDNIFFDISNHDFMIMDLPPPSVSVEISPSEQTACTHFGVLTFDITAEPAWGFSADLAVEVLQKPIGTEVELSNPILAADGSITLALLEAGNVPVGTSELKLKLTGGDTEILLNVPLQLEGPPTVLPSWFSPTSGMEIFSPNVLLNWNVVEEATAFKVELATSPAFGSTTVLSAEVEDEFYLFQGLTKGLVYYWRVTVMNECGEGASTPITAFRSSNLPTINKDITLNASTFPAIANDTRPITDNYLNAASSCCGPEEVIYTLLALPTAGQLLLDGQLLATGASFTQAQINQGALQYLSMGDQGAADSFSFSVRSDRGWILSEQLDIEIVDTQISLTEANRVICGEDGADYTFMVELAADGIEVVPSVSGLPEGLEASFNPTILQSSGEIRLEISQVGDLAQSGDVGFQANFTFGEVSQPFDLDLVVIPGAATPLLTSPAIGATVNPDVFELSWEAVGVVSRFILEIAEDNSFNEPLVSDTLSLPMFTWDGALPEQIYFWRVSAIGTCGASIPSEGRLIRTGFEECRTISFEGMDLQQLTDGVLSFEVEEQENVSQISISKLRMLYPNPDQLSLKMVSPSGNAATLLKEPACAGNHLLIRLADNAPQAYNEISTDCEPDFYYSIAGIYQPYQPFQVFENLPAMGTWQLQFQDNTTALEGVIEDLEVEICSFNDQPKEFSLIRNQTLWLYPRQNATINANFLQADASEAELDELIFVITAPPSSGNLMLNNQPIQLGDEFTQLDINQEKLTYLPSITSRTQDRFSFIVKAPKGRLVEEEDFNIEILGGDWYAESYYHQICAGQDTMEILFHKGAVIDAEGISFNVDGLPNGVEAVFEINAPAEAVSMRLTGLESLVNAFYPLSITLVSTNGQFTTGLLLEKKLGPGLTFLMQPYDGTKIDENTVFLEWFETNRADRYLVEVATRPTFGNTTFVSEIVEGTKYQLLNIPDGAIYYWRVTGMNDCAAGIPGKAYAFQHMEPHCETFTNTHNPSVFGFETDGVAIGKITIDQEWPISRIGLDNMRIYHPNVDQVTGSLISPSGTGIQLFERPLLLGGCGNETFLMSFDDDALFGATEFLNLCDEPTLFDVSETVQPIDPFANFAGEIATGDWELFLSNQDIEGGIGLLERWSLDVCFDTLLGQANYRSIDLQMALASEATITTNNLETTLEGTELRDIIYILTKIPAYGELILNDRVLDIGSTFNQFDINEGRLSYRHGGETSVLLDDIEFNIHFPDDLWWPNRSLNIILDTPEPTWEVLVTSDSTCLQAGSLVLDVLVMEQTYGPYFYSIDSVDFQSSPIFSGLSPGVFTVYLRYGNDQIAQQFVEVKGLTATYHIDEKDIEVLAEGGFPPYSYRLDDGDFQESPFFLNAKSGIHEITLMDAQSCTYVFQLEVPFTVSEGTIDFPLPPFIPTQGEGEEFYGPTIPASQASTQNEWTLYPNPSRGLFFLDWKKQEVQAGDELWIVNSTGQSIKKLSMTGDRDHLTLDLRSMPVGIYRIFLKQVSGVSVKEIVIYR